MFPGGSRHGDKDLFSEGNDEQQLFTEEMSPLEQNVFPGTENPCNVKRGETLPESLVSHSIVQEILSGNRDTQHVVQEILTGECFPLYMDENYFSKEPGSEPNFPKNSVAHQNVFPESHGTHRFDDRPNTNNYNIPPDNLLEEAREEMERSRRKDEREVDEGGFGRQGNSSHQQFNFRDCLPVQQAVALPRNQANQQDFFSRERELSRETRIPQRLDVRPMPRQLDMGKFKSTFSYINFI